MEHDPLRDSDNALLRLVEGRELCLHSVIGVCHDRYLVAQCTGSGVSFCVEAITERSMRVSGGPRDKIVG